MRKRQIGWAAAALALLTQGIAPAGAAEPYEVNVVLPLSGGASFVGQGQKDTLEALALSVDASGGVGGRDVRFVFHDDQSSPQVAVQLTKASLENKPAAIMGSSIVAMCLAMAPLMQNGPVHYCLSPAIHPKPGSYTFSASSDSQDQIAAVVRYYRMKGWTKLAVLDTTDASGLDGDRAIDAVLAYPENKGVTKVVQEHFNPTDISIAAQLQRIKQSCAQAMIAWVTGAPAATVFRAMAQSGLDIPVAPTSGNQTFAAMRQWKGFLPNQLILASALYPDHKGVLTLPPALENAQHEMYDILKTRHLKADNMVATSWDAGLIILSGLRKLGPKATAEQLKSYISTLTGFAGVDGVYDFKKYPQRGLGPESSTVTTYDRTSDSWIWLSKPGGEPLKK